MTGFTDSHSQAKALPGKQSEPVLCKSSGIMCLATLVRLPAQYFEEMDQHAVWCRDAQVFANMLAEGERFDHAQKFRDAIDESQRGGPVADVIRVSPVSFRGAHVKWVSELAAAWVRFHCICSCLHVSHFSWVC